MGREGQWIEQPINQTVNIADWKGDDEFEVYPEGVRDKSLLNSPEQSEYDFLIPNHRYLFKYSFKRHPDQFWTEIIAYRIGCLMEIPVPPAFVAYDSDNNVCGALIEWFFDKHSALKNRIQNKLALFQKEHLKAMMITCSEYPANIPLSQTRAVFVCDLVTARFKAICNKITTL